jgi:hypothetical protein
LSNDETYAGWARASAGSSGALEAGGLMMGPGAVKGVLVRELVDITTYRGRRASFNGVTGTIRGLVATQAVALKPDGQASSVAGPTKLVLVDDFGHEHQLEFGAHDYVTLLD